MRWDTRTIRAVTRRRWTKKKKEHHAPRGVTKLGGRFPREGDHPAQVTSLFRARQEDDPRDTSKSFPRAQATRGHPEHRDWVGRLGGSPAGSASLARVEPGRLSRQAYIPPGEPHLYSWMELYCTSRTAPLLGLMVDAHFLLSVSHILSVLSWPSHRVAQVAPGVRRVTPQSARQRETRAATPFPPTDARGDDPPREPTTQGGGLIDAFRVPTPL